MSKLHVIQPDIMQGFKHVVDFGDILEVHHRLLDIHFEHFLNVLFFEAHLQSFPVESSAFANRAGDPDICEEIHFKPIAAIAFASFASATRPVETKATFLVSPNLCFW